MDAAIINTPAHSPSSNPDSTIKSAMSIDAIMAPMDIDTISSDVSTSPAGLVTGMARMLGTPSPDRHVSPGEISTAISSSGEVAGSSDVEDVHGHRNGLQYNHGVNQGAREFTCMFDEYSTCQTGQYTLKLSRKVISNHFGRNKACTRYIQDWPLFCRKHYQRATYKPGLWQHRKVDLILRQFGVIEKHHPGTTYRVSLKKSEEKRLNDFARLMASGSTPEQAHAVVVPNSNIKSFQAPIDVLRELEYHLGPGKTIDGVKSTLALINQMLRNDETTEVPSIEFLPELGNDPAKSITPAKAKAALTKLTKSLSRTGRISRKGAIQKTRQ